MGFIGFVEFEHMGFIGFLELVVKRRFVGFVEFVGFLGFGIDRLGK